MRHHGAIWDLIYFFWVGYMGETRRFPSYDCPAIIRHDHLLQCYHKLIENVKEMAEFRHSSPKPAFFSDHAFANSANLVDAPDMIISRPLFGSGPHPLLRIVL
ncbi:MAG: hypothetical protein BVN33_09735 [Proteobacteria bacterium ST_bin13]|nr:MAG: hypothetical protein BVN33_09735 [Proteobacteria bacterium ST_bin13]